MQDICRSAARAQWCLLSKRLGLKRGIWLICVGAVFSALSFGQQTMVLAGSGSTLASPIFNLWSKAFNRDHHSIRVGYIPTNSAEGIRQIRMLMGDFAIGEIPLTREQMEGSSIHLAEIPIAVVNVVPVYNIPAIRHLRFTPELLAQIYMGKIVKWNDIRIAVCNPDADLPALPVIVVDRREGGGTRYLWTEFLSHTSREYRAWTSSIPHQRAGEVMVGTSGEMAQQIALTPGAFGYTEMGLAVRHGLAMGGVRNRAGKFVQASEASVQAAGNAKEEAASQDFKVPLVDAEGENSYPIIGFSWAFVPISGVPTERRSAVREFLVWSLKEGQSLASGSGYSPLPVGVAARARAQLESEVR